MAPSSSSRPEPTLRSLRRTNDTGSKESSAGRQRKESRLKGLTPQEAMAKRAAKPLLAKGHHFKWHSQAQQMKDMTVDLQRVRDRRDMLEGEDEAGEDETHSLFGTALGRSSLINLSLPFIAFSRSIEPKTRSLPLVIHHREVIVEAVCSALRSSAHDIELCGETILESVLMISNDAAGVF